MKSLPVIYSQRDPRWASQRLGTVDGSTLGDYGCYITSFAMLASYYGKTITPAQLDDLFTNKGWYVSGNLLTDNGLTKAYPDIVYQQTIPYTAGPADLNKLKNLLADPSTMVVLEVDFSPEQSGIQTHFVVAVTCDGTKVMIADPWTGTIHDITTFGDAKTTIQKFVIYKGPVTTQPATPDATIYKGYDLTNKASMMVAVDILVRVQAGEFVDKPVYEKMKKDLERERDNARSDANSKQQTIDNLNTQINKLHSDMSLLQTQISNLSAQLLNATNTTDSLRGQADELVELKKQFAQLQSDRQAEKLRYEKEAESSRMSISQKDRRYRELVENAPKAFFQWLKLKFIK